MCRAMCEADIRESKMLCTFPGTHWCSVQVNQYHLYWKADSIALMVADLLCSVPAVIIEERQLKKIPRRKQPGDKKGRA